MAYFFHGCPLRGCYAGVNPFNRIISHVFCCALLAAALLSGCTPGSTPAPEAEQSAEQTASTLSDDAQIALNLLTLREATEKNDTESALRALDSLLKLAPAPELYVQKAMLLVRSGSADKAVEAIRQGTLKYPADYDLHMVWAELLQQSGLQDQALGVLNGFYARYALLKPEERRKRQDEIDNVRQLTVFILLNSRRFNEAETYLRAVPHRELSPTLLFYEVVLLRNQGKEREATVKLYDLVKNHPDFTDGWLTLASDMEKRGDYKSAVRFYNKALGLTPVTEIYLRMLGAQIKSGDVRGAQIQVIAAPFSSEVKLRASVLFMDAKEYKAARSILLTLQNDPFAADDAAMYLAMISYDTGDNVKESLDRLRDISPDAPNRSRMMYLKALLHIRDNDYPAALEASKALRDEYPENKEHWAFLAELANVSKNYKLAESVSREALEQWPDDTEIMHSLAMSLSMQVKNSQAIQILEDILLLDESNLMAMNGLAYTLAEEKRDLERALILARKALARAPDNSSIMDTLAWVHYQLGNYEEAWLLIKQCAVKGVEEAVLWDHYGDIARALGNNKDARIGYTRALEMDPDNPAEIRKKLRSLK